jgi:hypothetical protein
MEMTLVNSLHSIFVLEKGKGRKGEGKRMKKNEKTGKKRTTKE